MTKRADIPDLFSEPEAALHRLTPRTRAKLAERAMADAQAAIPQALHALGLARDKAAPFEQAFWQAHHILAAAVQHPRSLTKSEVLKLYDARMEAGHAWHPHRMAVSAAEDWLIALQKEIADCEKVLGK